MMSLKLHLLIISILTGRPAVYFRNITAKLARNVVGIGVYLSRIRGGGRLLDHVRNEIN